MVDSHYGPHQPPVPFITLRMLSVVIAHSFIARRARVLVTVGALGLGLPLLARASAKLPTTVAWLLDLATHWQLLYLALVVAGAVLAASCGRNWRWLGALLLAPMPWLSAAPATLDGVGATWGNTFTVAEANIKVTNPDATRLIEWLRRVQPDMVVVLEVSPQLAKVLANEIAYPHQKLLPSEDPFGIALLSKHPMSEVEVRQLAAGNDYIRARLRWHGRDIELTALHTVPPLFGASYYRSRDEDIGNVLAFGRASKLPALIVGDLNATAWSSALFVAQAQQFLRTTSLAPTWNTVFHGLTGIPIDHVLASPDWKVIEQTRGPDIGSDHYPVLVKLAL